MKKLCIFAHLLTDDMQIAARYESSSQKYVWVPNVTLFEWMSGRLPLDFPLCGYSGLEGTCKQKGSKCDDFFVHDVDLLNCY
jgi:hypothetical protein